MECPRKFASVVPRRAVGGESLRLCLRRCSKTARIVMTWARRIRAEHHPIIEVGRHLCQTFDDFVNYLDKPIGRGTAALGHEEALVKDHIRGTAVI